MHGPLQKQVSWRNKSQPVQHNLANMRELICPAPGTCCWRPCGRTARSTSPSVRPASVGIMPNCPLLAQVYLNDGRGGAAATRAQNSAVPCGTDASVLLTALRESLATTFGNYGLGSALASLQGAQRCMHPAAAVMMPTLAARNCLRRHNVAHKWHHESLRHLLSIL